jgi:hypothetical protein
MLIRIIKRLLRKFHPALTGKRFGENFTSLIPCLDEAIKGDRWPYPLWPSSLPFTSNNPQFQAVYMQGCIVIHAVSDILVGPFTTETVPADPDQ